MPRPASDQKLRDLHEQGHRPLAIGLALGLASEAVRERLLALGLRPHTRRTKAPAPIDVVLAQLERPDEGCWIWCGPMHGKHPAVTVGGAQLLVARLLWEHFRAPMPRALRSTCGEARCVRPGHREEAPAARGRRHPVPAGQAGSGRFEWKK